MERETNEKDSINLKVQTQHYNAWLRPSTLNCERYENWKLSFDTEILYNGKIRISLIGREGKEQIKETIADGVVDPKQKNQQIILRTDGENNYLARALARENNEVKLIGKNTDKWVDDEENNEILTYTTLDVDVTSLYNRYCQAKNNKYKDSIFVNIEAQKYRTYGMILNCQLKGTNVKLSKTDEEASQQRYECLKAITKNPRYGFMAQEIVQKEFQSVLKRIEEARERASNIHKYKCHDGTYIRCKIDGIQQMGKKLNHQINDDIDKAVLVYLCYNQELTNRETAIGMKR